MSSRTPKKRVVRFYGLETLVVDPKAARAPIPANAEFLEALKPTNDWLVVGSNQIDASYFVRPFEGGVEIRSVYLGLDLAIGDTSGKIDEQILEDEQGPASTSTFVRLVAEGVVGGFQSQTDAPQVNQAIDAVSRVLTQESGFAPFRAVPIVSQSALKRLTGNHSKLKVRIPKGNLKQLAQRAPGLAECLESMDGLVDKDGEIEIVLREKKNRTWFGEKVVSRFVHEVTDGDALELLSAFQVDHPGKGGVNLLVENVTTSQPVPIPQGNRNPARSTAATVIGKAYAEVADQLD